MSDGTADLKNSWRDVAPFSISGIDKCAVPLLIAAPHGGRNYGADVVQNMRDFDSVSVKLEDRFIDLVARAVATSVGAASLIAHVPRAIIDLNRSSDDVDWSMVSGPAPENAVRHGNNRRARSGLGLVPRRLPGTGEVWSRRLAAEDLKNRIQLVHRPYHAVLGAALEAMRDRWGAVLLLDLHSMPPLRSERGQNGADFVLGDRFGGSCAPALVAESLRFFAGYGQAAAHNRPYAGGYVLDRHGAPARNIHALQLEVSRSLYLDDPMTQPASGMSALCNLLDDLCRHLAARVADLASSPPKGRMAAE
ncbi:N-formylglutamate amidohydrolase [Altererythrobacter sp. SALINAS58]|uniref:N-formylglutamate amidohydrolase n=1 Tax=Alteripontixanthobacter muriae TaxID=2705546 RepID=UPI001576150B|nr:N-formylglutamate amidohydrolase [Alteripontixanthobacter muriae]NTZ42984.1 N-formylglutamate amidohydrolase [Alteripontixanthobacter muriae]